MKCTDRNLARGGAELDAQPRAIRGASPRMPGDSAGFRRARAESSTGVGSVGRPVTPRQRRRCRVLGILLVLAGSGVQAAAQEVVRWQDFEPCGDAGTELVLHEVMRIGDATGAGIVESDLPRLTWSEEIGYFVLDGRGAWFKVFDQDGRFVRVVGRQGEGPGEFGAVALVRVVQGQIVALDVVRRLWHFFDLDGKYVDQRNLGFSAHWFEPVGGSFVVVAALDLRPPCFG